MIVRLSITTILFVLFVGSNQPVEAHDIFQDVLKEKYTLKSFSCKTCHPDSDDRKLRTPFAERIYQQMKDLGLSKKFAEATAIDEAAKAKDPESVGKEKGAVYEFEKIAAKDFDKAFVKVAQQTMTIDQIIKQGLFNGARLDTKAIEAAKQAEK
ncbi:hypothetical protein N9B09_01030 [bacterium]|nr:hypothetical protein [bacterium]